MLKDRFLTQLAPDIHRKLLKWAYGPNQSLDNLLQLAQTVYYGREYEGKKEWQKKTKAQVEALAMAMRTILKGFLNSLRKMPRGTQVKRDGLAITVERRGTLSGIALRHLSHPQLNVRSAKDHTGRETAPRGVGFTGWTQDLKVPTQAPVLITPVEPQVLITVGGLIRLFPFRYWDNLLCAY